MKLYFKTTGEYVKKNQAIYKLYSEDIAIAKQDYLHLPIMPGDFGAKCRRQASVPGLSMQQKCIKGKKQISHTLLL
jgi:Cu(I)/Ag(I) efflux system membrane fusion protein